MSRKAKRLPPYKLPRCSGRDGRPGHEGLAESVFRSCRAVATYRIEWTSATATLRRRDYEWKLLPRHDLACDRHLPMLLERAEHDIAFARSPYRDWSPAAVADLTLTRLEFGLDKRARAHGNTFYLPVEMPVTGPVQFTLF